MTTRRPSIPFEEAKRQLLAIPGVRRGYEEQRAKLNHQHPTQVCKAPAGIADAAEEAWLRQSVEHYKEWLANPSIGRPLSEYNREKDEQNRKRCEEERAKSTRMRTIRPKSIVIKDTVAGPTRVFDEVHIERRFTSKEGNS